jgi:exopolysaccharide biosynthesis WecB/TagA/CpsF family protein
MREVVAVVGTGPEADRLVHSLQMTTGGGIDVIGRFADEFGPQAAGASPGHGTVAQLLDLGKHRRIDWILLALPGHDELSLSAVVQRLKALSAPIGLCPAADDDVGAIGTNLHTSQAQTFVDSLPRWCLTLLTMPVLAARAVWRLRRAPLQTAAAGPPLILSLDDHDLSSFVDQAATFGQHRYGYGVTPNTDHVIRLGDDPAFRALYDDASFVLLDSRFLSHWFRATRGLHLPVCTGSDLTQRLFSEVIRADDPIVLVGSSARQAEQLRQRFGLTRLSHINPAMGFINDEVAVERCLQFVEAHSPFRFCLLAVGSPQQERLAQRLGARGLARGLALCIGASINFRTGDEQRSPRWMQSSGLEWVYRLVSNPRRMLHRYLWRGPRIFSLLRRTEVVLRRPANSTGARLAVDG